MDYCKKYFLHLKQLRLIRIYFLLPIILFLGFSTPSNSQNVSLNASLDTNTIVIGGQLTMTIEMTKPAGMKIPFPVVADTFSLMEVVKRSEVDTSTDSGEIVTLKQHFVLTSFDSGYHVIPPFIILGEISGDSATHLAESKPLLVTVQGIPVDTNKTIKDLKGQMIVPLSWQDFLPWIFGVLLLAAAIYLIYRYFKNRKVKDKTVEVVVPKRPAHEIALEQLRALEESKLWQQGNYKGYYTALSDITRTFIENRWAYNAMEMTTDEILQLTFIKNQPQQNFEELKYLLETSDLVKFAKMIPVVFENEQSMKNAVGFVKANILVHVEKEVVV